MAADNIELVRGKLLELAKEFASINEKLKEFENEELFRNALVSAIGLLLETNCHNRLEAIGILEAAKQNQFITMFGKAREAEARKEIG
jgi:hypothetical protein